jgi:hypothetical protein
MIVDELGVDLPLWIQYVYVERSADMWLLS